MDKINEYLKENCEYDEVCEQRYFRPTKRILCKDGFNISVQANRGSYCEPREDGAWPYSEVELGYPSELDPLIREYAEDVDTTDTVFAYVPISVVNELVNRHGGIFTQETES